ncbi:hypothetical protein Hanom_Chr17g01546391 [Helianthus anomalus]
MNSSASTILLEAARESDAANSAVVSINPASTGHGFGANNSVFAIWVPNFNGNWFCHCYWRMNKRVKCI